MARRRLPRRPGGARLFAVAFALAVIGGACGAPARHAPAVLDAAGQPVGPAAANASALMWRAHAATVLGAMDQFFTTLQSTGAVNRDAIIRACGTAEPHLADLSLPVASPYPDAVTERHVREALSGFSDYVRSCADGDDRAAETAFRYYDEGSQAAALAIGVQSDPSVAGIQLLSSR